MPNVNYRGNPSQDPNVPPEAGVTSIPLGSPWPPLGREQVVKLHEALVMWRRAEERVGAHTRAEYNARNPANVDDQLLDLLVRLGIGSPPPTRTWTHEEVAKVAEEVQDGANLTPVEPAWLRLDWGSVQVPVRNLSGQGLAEGQMVTTAQVQVESPKRNCWSCDHDKVFGGGTAHICTALPPRRAKGTGDPPTVKAISAWTDSQTLDASLMPPKDSDGCPGWESKPSDAVVHLERWMKGGTL